EKLWLPHPWNRPGPANALYCYTCNWEQSNWSCLKAEKCSEQDEYCVTNVASVGIGGCCPGGPKTDPKI
uniref:Snake toxin/toxin-like domain-containing protein n=1 Tax=Ficedula albicollis TaxID=59894 RepID=U3K4M5_FICAL